MCVCVCVCVCVCDKDLFYCKLTPGIVNIKQKNKYQ